MSENTKTENPGEQKNRKESGTAEELRTNVDHQNSPASRRGITDMNNESATGGGHHPREGSGMSSKIGLTGSDYDGQVSE